MQLTANWSLPEVRKPIAATVITPPYRDAEAASDTVSLTERSLSPGSIVCVEVDGNRVPDDELLSNGILELRRHCAAAPVVLRVHGPLDSEIAHLIARVMRLHVRGVIVDGEPLRETLRRFLTTPVDLSTDVAEWLCLRLPRLSPQVVELLRKIFHYAPRETEVAALLEKAGEPARTARARLRKLALPSPASWLNAARALHAALCLQRDQSTPIFKISVELGYCDHSALSHQLMRAFGMQTSRIRALLGWEWLLDAWLVRAARISAAM